MSDKKAWYTSKTLWANAVGIALVALKFFGVIGGEDIPNEYELAGIVAFVINLVLRIITKKKLVG